MRGHQDSTIQHHTELYSTLRDGPRVVHVFGDNVLHHDISEYFGSHVVLEHLLARLEVVVANNILCACETPALWRTILHNTALYLRGVDVELPRRGLDSHVALLHGQGSLHQLRQLDAPVPLLVHALDDPRDLVLRQRRLQRVDGGAQLLVGQIS